MGGRAFLCHASFGPGVVPVSRWSRCSITVCFTPSEVDSLDSLEGERIDPFSLGTQPGPRSGNRQISRHGTRGDLLSASAVCRNCRTAESVRFGESSDTATRKSGPRSLQPQGFGCFGILPLQRCIFIATKHHGKMPTF